MVWHHSGSTGYPADADIEEWSKYSNILLQQAEVMLWKDWKVRFVPRNGIEEFERVNKACEDFGMRNFVYTSPYFFLTGTGKEDNAMNSFDNFTGYGPGDGRGLNWPIFLDEIKIVMQRYKPDGLYFDGIYHNVVRTYLIARKAREVVGDEGILEYHATTSPPGAGVYVPQIDAYFNFILRGENRQHLYQSDDYLRYFISTHNISNSIGVLCNNNNYTLDEALINTLLDSNIRLHLIPSWLSDYRKDAMEKLYWPALDDSLRERVAGACERRQETGRASWDEWWETMTAEPGDLELVFEETFDQPQFSAAAPSAPPNAKAQTQPAVDPVYLKLPNGWRAYFSPNSAGSLQADNGVLKITGRANTCACIERALPNSVVAVQAKLRCLPNGGASWGPGLLLRIGGRHYRLNARSDDRIAIDRQTGQVPLDGFHHSIWYWVRLRLVGSYIRYEVSRDGEQWQPTWAEPIDPGGEKSLLVGKIADGNRKQEHNYLGHIGLSYIDDIRVFEAKTGASTAGASESE